MKTKFLTVLILCFTLTMVFTSTAFAMDSYESNNTPTSATPVMEGDPIQANLDAGDVDCYILSKSATGSETVHFIPGDNQTYYVAIYDNHILDTSGTSFSPLTFKIVSQGNIGSLSFTGDANHAYWIRIFGNNTTTTPYYVLFP